MTLSPIPNWQASWTASQAQGTAIALVVEDCVVLFLRSPATNVYKPKVPTVHRHPTEGLKEEEDDPDYAETTVVSELHGLPVEMVDLDHPSMTVQYAPPWFAIGSHSVCAMTGLAMDVEHLVRVVQKRVDDHYNLFRKSLTTHVMTQSLASILQGACLADGGTRPYGVQALLVGCDDIDGDNGADGGRTAAAGSAALCIYSIDPSGSWQSWGRATAIGRYATEVRLVLARELRRKRRRRRSSGEDDGNNNNNNNNGGVAAAATTTSATTGTAGAVPHGLEESVECLFEIWKETCRQQNVHTGDDRNKEDYEVLILQRDPRNRSKSRLFRVPSKTVSGILDRLEAKVEK
jgi:20S proteasome alpha/beta subunit